MALARGQDWPNADFGELHDRHDFAPCRAIHESACIVASNYVYRFTHQNSGAVARQSGECWPLAVFRCGLPLTCRQPLRKEGRLAMIP